jgi:ribonuclease HII
MWPIEYKERIKEIGFNDSKQLTENDRENLYCNI